jgi:hypothetical protein
MAKAKKATKMPAAKKPAKKATPKKKPAPKATPKKKPAPKATPKKPATKTKAKAKSKPAKSPPSSTQNGRPLSDQIDMMRSIGMNVASHEARDEAATAASTKPQHGRIQQEVLSAFRTFYPQDATDEAILAIDPNDYDLDPSPFYEYLEERFGVPGDPEQDYFGGYGGSIRDTIAFLTPRWDGKLHDASSGADADDEPTD